MRILLCDDHRIFGEAFEVVLAARGHDVVATSTDASAALEVIEREKVDLCLLDLQLVGGTSVPYIPALLERSPGMKIVILSGTDDAELLRSGLAAGASAAARKSDDIEKILDLLERVAAGDTVPVPSLPAREVTASAATPAQRLASYLTNREREILERLVRGESTAVIARSIGIQHSTARTHVQNLLTKLGVHSKLEAVSFAITHGIVVPGDDDGGAGAEDRNHSR